jgi:hypothetical protein
MEAGSAARSRKDATFYAFTAPLVVETVERILDGRVRSSDALAPGATFDSTDFLHCLAPEYLTCEFGAD